MHPSPPIPPPAGDPPAALPEIKNVPFARRLLLAGRKLLVILLWCGLSLFGTTALLSLSNAYAVASGFPTKITLTFLLQIAASNGLAAALCLLFILLLQKKRRASNAAFDRK